MARRLWYVCLTRRRRLFYQFIFDAFPFGVSVRGGVFTAADGQVRMAFKKRIATNVGHAIRYGHACEYLTPKKRVSADVFNTVRQDYAYETRTLLKRTSTDSCQTVRQGDVFEACTAIKRIVAYTDDTTR